IRGRYGFAVDCRWQIDYSGKWAVQNTHRVYRAMMIGTDWLPHSADSQRAVVELHSDLIFVDARDFGDDVNDALGLIHVNSGTPPTCRACSRPNLNGS